MFSGTTAVIILMYKDMIVCANAGDSRAVMFEKSQYGNWNAVALSRDLKPTESDEVDRILRTNGRIE